MKKHNRLHFAGVHVTFKGSIDGSA